MNHEIPKLSAVRKVLETLLFLALESFGTLGPKLSHGTSAKFADIRTHLRKVLRRLCLQSKSLSQRSSFFVLINFKSTGVQTVIGSFFCHQGSVVASLDDASVVHHHDHIGIDNRR